MTTLVLKIDAKKPEEKVIRRAAALLKKGKLVAFPTETVYGLGANALDRRAMAKLRAAKERPKGKPFTVHIADTTIINKMGCRMTKEAKLLSDKFWPGPLTMILRNANGRKIGFRMPDNLVALKIIKRAGVPIAAPSANLSGERPPKSARGVLASLDGKIELLLDAGKTAVGIESTVVDMTTTPPRILREGAVSRREIVRVIKSSSS